MFTCLVQNTLGRIGRVVYRTLSNMKLYGKVFILKSVKVFNMLSFYNLAINIDGIDKELRNVNPVPDALEVDLPSGFYFN